MSPEFQNQFDRDVFMCESKIVVRLHDFFCEMGTWESECNTKYRKARRQEMSFDQATSESLDALKALFQRFCTTWNTPARSSKGSLQFSTIQTYGVECETVSSIEVNDDIARVVTSQQIGPKDKLVYYLKRIDGEWRLEDRRKRIDSSGNEVDWDL